MTTPTPTTWRARMRFSLVLFLGLGAGLCVKGSGFNWSICFGYVGLAAFGLILRETIFGSNFLDQQDLSSRLGLLIALDSSADLAQPGSYEFYYAGSYIDRGIAQKRERREINKAIEPKKRIMAQIASLAVAGAAFWLVIQGNNGHPPIALLLTLPAMGLLVSAVSISQLLLPVFFITIAVISSLPGEFDQPPWQLQIIFGLLFLHLRLFKLARIEMQLDTATTPDEYLWSPFLRASSRDIGIFILILWVASYFIPQTGSKLSVVSPTHNRTNTQFNGLITQARKLNQWAGNRWSPEPGKRGSNLELGHAASSHSSNSSSSFSSMNGNETQASQSRDASAEPHSPISPEERVQVQPQPQIDPHSTVKLPGTPAVSDSSAESRSDDGTNQQSSKGGGDEAESKKILPQESRPPLIADELLLKILSYIKWIFFGTLGSALFISLFRWWSEFSQKKKSLSRKKRNPHQSQALREFRAQIAALKNARLNSKQEVIRRYQLFLELMKGSVLPRADFLPTSDYHEELRRNYPGFSKSILNLNETYCNVFYGNQEVNENELKLYREDFDTLTQLFL